MTVPEVADALEILSTPPTPGSGQPGSLSRPRSLDTKRAAEGDDALVAAESQSSCARGGGPWRAASDSVRSRAHSECAEVASGRRCVQARTYRPSASRCCGGRELVASGRRSRRRGGGGRASLFGASRSLWSGNPGPECSLGDHDSSRRRAEQCSGGSTSACTCSSAGPAPAVAPPGYGTCCTREARSARARGGAALDRDQEPQRGSRRRGAQGPRRASAKVPERPPRRRTPRRSRSGSLLLGARQRSQGRARAAGTTFARRGARSASVRPSARADALRAWVSSFVGEQRKRHREPEPERDPLELLERKRFLEHGRDIELTKVQAVERATRRPS